MGNIEEKSCFETEKGNYLVVDTPGVVPPGTEYWVFFSARRVTDPAISAIKVYVESAYAGDPARAPRSRRGQKKRFRALVSKLAGLT